MTLRILAGVCVCVATHITAAAQSLSAPPMLDDVNVVWDSPSANAAGSMPIGNGEVVLNVWVEVKTGDLLVLLARTDALSETCRFLKLGRLRVHIDGSPLAQTKDLRQELKLREGAINITGGGAALKVFVDAGAHVVHIMGEAKEPLSVTATIECWRNTEMDITDESSWTTRNAPFKRTESADVFAPEKDAVVWYHRNETSVVPKLLETQSMTGEKGTFDPLLHRTFGGQLTGKGFVSDGERGLKSDGAVKTFALQLATHSAQTDTVERWRAELKREAEKSANADEALVRTQRWWADFWGRSWVFITKKCMLPYNTYPLRIGCDRDGNNRFSGEIEPQPVLPVALREEEMTKLVAKGRTPDGPKITPEVPKEYEGLTFSAWIKPEGNPKATGKIFDKRTPDGDDGLSFDLSDGNLRLYVARTFIGGVRVKPDEWQHVAATFNTNGEVAIFCNGKKRASERWRDIKTSSYILQRFAQGFQGRGAYPIKFNGGFFTVERIYCLPKDKTNPDWRQWGDCYWWQNTRHMYHAMLASGDFDLMAPLFGMYGNARVVAESRTAKYHKASGAYFPETMTLFGTYGSDYAWDRTHRQPKDVGCPWWEFTWNQGPELVALMLDRYDYTNDGTFLKNEVLPMAESVLTYFDTRFSKNAAGNIILNPTQAIETYRPPVTNDSPTVAGIANISRRLVALPEELTTPDQRAFFAKMQAACPAIPLKTVNGVRMLAAAEKHNPDTCNGENPETYPIWPYREVSLLRPQLLPEARQAYAARKFHLTNGWGYDGNCAALLGLADEAATVLQVHGFNSHPCYRWPATWGPNYDYLPDQNHGGNLLETTHLMLLQGESGGKILLMPAWPKYWDVSFKLHAPNKTTVECVYRNGKIEELVVTPESRLKDIECSLPLPAATKGVQQK